MLVFLRWFFVFRLFWVFFGIPAIALSLVLASFGTARAQFDPPALPPLDSHAEEVGGMGKWHIHLPSTLPGWHYSLEELGADGATWSPSPGGQFYGNGQPLKYFVTDGPLPGTGDPTGPPPGPGASSWQLRWISFRIEQQKNALGTSFRIRREATTVPSTGAPVAVAAWDAVLTEPLPPLPVGSRTFIFQGWDDPVARIMWQTDFIITTTEGPPPAESLSATPEEAAELNVFQQVKAQLIGAITTPPSTAPAPVPGAGRRILRLRRSRPDTNRNGIPDWWELAHHFPVFAAFDATTTDTASDPDRDGLAAQLEYEYGTNPRKPDTDDDGLSDLEEIKADSDPLRFDLPGLTLEYAWREAEGADTRASSAGGSRTITGKAINGTTERLWSMTVPASSGAINEVNAVNAVNSIMGTNGTGTNPEMAWSAWTPWAGSARARWRQTFEGDAGSGISPPPLMRHSFARRDIKIRLKATRKMPVAWKVLLQKTVFSQDNGQPGRQWTSWSTFPNPVTLSLAVDQSEAVVTLSPADTVTPGTPTGTNPLNEALVEYAITSVGIPAYPGSLDGDGDGLPNATELKIGTDPAVFSTPGPDGQSNSLSDSLSGVGGLGVGTVQFVTAIRSLGGVHFSNGSTSGWLGFARSWGTAPPPQTPAQASYKAFNNKLDFMTFPTAAPLTAPRDQWADGEVSCRALATQFISSQVAHWAFLEHKRVWGVMTPAPKENTIRTFIRHTSEKLHSAAERHTAEIVTLNFDAGKSVSINSTDLTPAFTEHHTGTWIEMRLLPVDFIVPDVPPSESQPVMARASGDTPDGYAGDPGSPGLPVIAHPARNPAADLTGFSAKPVTALKIAKMENALKADDNLDARYDPDLFRLRIRGLPAGTAASFLLRTDKKDGHPLDPATKINLTQAGAGADYFSPSLLLVADIGDDTGSPATAGNDEAENDRTHRAELGGTATAESITLNFPAPAAAITLPVSSLTASVPVRKTVTVRIRRFLDCPKTLAVINSEIELMRQRYMQVGITFNVPPVQEIPVPATFGNLGSTVGSSDSHAIDFRENDIATAYPKPANPNEFPEIQVFYCRELRYPGAGIRGFARTGGGEKYINFAYLSGTQAVYYTLAHEVGHLLTKAGHFGTNVAPGDYDPGAPAHQTRHNLMRGGGLDASSHISASKRLYRKQETMIFSKKKP